MICATHILIVISLKLNSLVEEILQDGKDTITLQAALQAREELEVKLDLAPLAELDLLLDLGRCLGQKVIDHATRRLRLLGRLRLILAPVLHARIQAIVPAVRRGSGSGRGRLVRQGVHDQHDGGRERRLEWLLDGELQHQIDEVGAQPLVVVVVGQEVRDPVDLLLDTTEGVVGEVDDLLAQAGRDRGLVTASGTALVAVGLLVVVILCSVEKGSVPDGRIIFECQLLGRKLSALVDASWSCLLTPVSPLSGIVTSAALSAIVVGHVWMSLLATGCVGEEMRVSSIAEGIEGSFATSAPKVGPQLFAGPCRSGSLAPRS